MERATSASRWHLDGGRYEDIITAKNHGVKVMAVLCVVSAIALNELYQPDLLKEDLSEAVVSPAPFSKEWV